MFTARYELGFLIERNTFHPYRVNLATRWRRGVKLWPRPLYIILYLLYYIILYLFYYNIFIILYYIYYIILYYIILYAACFGSYQASIWETN